MTAKNRKPDPAPAKRTQIDWEAIQRDYRTGRMTDGELSAKHGVSREAIVRRRKREPDSWPQDLSKAVREATNAAVVREMITAAITDGHSKITTSVLAAAEVGKDVILRHRSDILAARTVAYDLLAELQKSAMLAEHQDLLAEILAGEGATLKDANEARTAVARALGLGGRVSSVKSLADALTKLQAAERIAFKLDEDDQGDTNSAGVRQLTDAERAVRLARLMAQQDEDSAE